MTLGSKQELFAELFAQLIIYARTIGYKVRIGEVHRPREMAKIYAEQGIGIVNSNHTRCIAADIALMLKGVYQTKTPQYEKLGEYWESLHPLCCWGGRFGDGGHFSLEHNGVK
ncbi:unnamed protein product [marine sediment metagenome]|uniref:Peptidase M15C domain-containing protein n=1 Tax=marine sediment metagenome TaxID=412755 RepID=X0V1T4_9ZZZZ